MDVFLIRITGYLIIAMLVAIVARLLRLPYTVGLVLVGIFISVTGFAAGTVLTHDFIFYIVLPPLLFEAALSIYWTALRRDLVPILVLSIFGVVISAAVVAAGMVNLLLWPAIPAVYFAILIAATDPVAVLAMFKDTGLKGRLRLLVESESLFNDGVAAVLSGLLLVWVQMPTDESVTYGSGFLSLLTVTMGGTVMGLLCGGAIIAIAGRVSDHLIETTLTVIAAYGSFLLAEKCHVSGVLATVSAGLVMGNLGILREDAPANLLSQEARAFVIAFWEFAAFLANSLIFC